MKQCRAIVLTLALLLCSVIWGQHRVNYISSDNNTITLRTTAYASKIEKAIETAEQEAIKAILFRGIPDSQQNIPLVGTDEKTFINKYPDYFQSLFHYKRYTSFILSSIPQTEFAKDQTKKKCITMDVRVNLKALRADLEQQSIIRKFGL